MISELTFIRTYTSFWNSLFPGGEDYIRLINSSLGERVAKPIEIEDYPFRRALINSISFSLFEKIISKSLFVEEFQALKVDSELLLNLSIDEKLFLSNLRFGEKVSYTVSENELQIIKILTRRLLSQYSHSYKTICRPHFKGCGILFESQGDLIYNTTLVEVKAGLRNFSILDIRQLYVYLSLTHQSKEYEITCIELFNPRTGIVWQALVDAVSEYIAGASSMEVCQEIINFISNNNHSL